MNTLVDLGKVALTLGGVWNGATNYERLTYVLYDDDGCGYVALANNVGVRPGTNSSVWQKATLAGKSIYQLCVDHGTFVGTEEEFVAAYNAAVTAAQEAAAAATRCTDLNDHPMRISESTYHWEKWDEDTQQYVDTGIMATGSPYAEFDIDQTTGQLTVETDNLYCGPTFELDAANGNLELSI